MVVESDAEASADVRELRREDAPRASRERDGADKWKNRPRHSRSIAARLEHASIEVGVVRSEEARAADLVADEGPYLCEHGRVLDHLPGDAVNVRELEFAPRRANRERLSTHDLPGPNDHDPKRTRRVRPAVRGLEIDGRKRPSRMFRGTHIDETPRLPATDAPRVVRPRAYARLRARRGVRHVRRARAARVAAARQAPLVGAAHDGRVRLLLRPRSRWAGNVSYASGQSEAGRFSLRAPHRRDPILH